MSHRTRRILIVDNEEAISRSLRRHLARHAETECAKSADAALRMIGESAFDVVVTDFEMDPGHDGVWLLERVREHDARIQRILMSGRPAATFEAHVRSGLVQAFLSKPVTGATVMAAIEAGDRPRTTG